MKKFLLLLLTTLVIGGLFAAPLNESFSGSTFPPSGWTVYNLDGGYTWVRNTDSSHYRTAPAGASIRYDSASTHDDWLVTPCLVPSASNYTLSFWASHYYSYPETFKVWISTASNAVSDFTTQLGSEVTTTTTWTQYDYDLSAYIGMPIYFAIQATSLNQYYLRVDDFTGPDLITYPEPSNHVTGFAATPSYTNVKLDWTGSTGTQLPVGYLIQAIRVGAGSYAAVADGTPVAYDTDWSDGNAAVTVPHVVGANTYTFSGLISNAAYEFKIWPYTNDGADIDFKVDTPIPTVSATTMDATIYAADLPYLQNFDSVTPPALPEGWLSLDNNGDGDKWVTSTSYPHSSPNSVRIYTDYNTSNDDYLVTPRVELTGNQRLKFWTRAHSASSSETDEISVLLSSTTPDAANFTLTAMASTAIDFTTYTEYTIDLSAYNGFHYIAFARKNAPADGWYLYVDDILIEDIPQAGLLTVNPNPVNCGTSYIGIQKTVQVSLTNTGVAAFDVTSIALADYTNFNLANLPALPVTINPGDPAVTFDVVFTPTVTGALTTNLLINDTRQASSIVVNGTGVQALVGEICENPYLATLPLVDYAGTTAGYANDYTSAMFTGLNTAGYVNGKDWVAKVSIPEDGWLTISLTDQAGYSSQWMGVFLVNTIPSVANPATVLAQATASSGLMSIDDEVVTAGDYYVIVDNWPSPADVYFVLNISFQPYPSGPVAAPNLDYPADRQTDLPKTGFPFQFSWNMAGAEPEQYDLWIAKVSDLTITPYDPDEFFNVAEEFPNVTSPYQPAFTYDYSEVYVWTVLGSRGTDPDQFQWPPYEFTIENPPLVITYIPYGDDFENHADDTLPTGWTRSSQGEGWIVSTDHSSQYFSIPAHTVYASANDDALGSGNDGSMDLLTLPLFDLSGITENDFQLKFDSYFTGTYGQLADVEISVDGGAWTSIYSVPAASVWTEHVVNLSAYKPNQFQLRFHSDDNGGWASGWAIDNVFVEAILDYDAEAVSIDMYQVVEPVAFNPMATVGNKGAQTISFTVTMTIGGTTLPAQSVTALAPGETQQLSFGSFTPVANTFNDVTVTTNLAGDENPANDTIAGQFVCLELNKTAYADVAHDASGALSGPATFSLRNPGAITDLAPGNPYTNPDSWLCAADWINGGWWGTDYYGTDWWQIDTTTGAGTDNGDVGIAMTGVAWDPVADVVYGVNANNLYTLDRLTGAPTLIGQLTWDGAAFDGLFIDIAWNNNNGTLYGLDLGYDAVFTIDPATLAITPLGYTVGYDLNYAQGMAFDQDTGLLYLAAYAGAGALMWVNTVQPDADGLLGEAYVIGIFQNNSEVDGFVIPYPQLAIPNLTIALESGVPTLSWNSIVGATAYKVYGSSDPYADDPWTLVATTASTTYAYTGTEPYHFFKVTAIDGPAPARTQFTGIERVRQVMQPTKVQSIRAKGPKAAEMGAFNPIKK
ncbi:MAG: choice-of-anchor J domain-containing protein [Candidatus Cloacimonadota bacterium]|nr:choice-of-anchor J domain-containing protein [Candidatus Cloacimonadota bacterium]